MSDNKIIKYQWLSWVGMVEKKESYAIKSTQQDYRFGVEKNKDNTLKPMQQDSQPEDQKQKLREMHHVSLWLDDYNDIFSDFDPRPYSKRLLSADFLFEAKRAARETALSKTELKLLVPTDKRNIYSEKIIKKRLRDHFKKQFSILQAKKKKTFNQGIIFVIVGILFMIVSTFILVKYYKKNFFMTFLSVLAEPAGWFLFWEGLNLVLFGFKEREKDFEFNEKMSKCRIDFLSY